MLALANRKVFRPNAAWIPDGKEGTDFDRDDCTFLYAPGEYSHGEASTEEAWKLGGAPSYVHERCEFTLPDGSPIRQGKVQLLADACIVKIPERDYWCDEVQAMTRRVFGVYALDRRQHHHLCELCASYELWFVDTQYEESDDVANDDYKRSDLNEMILEGNACEEPVTYQHVKDIDPLFTRGRRCRPGWLPKGDRAGGYRLRGLRSITWEAILEEVCEATNNSDI